MIALAPHVLEGVLHLAEASDGAEPELLRRIAEGVPLEKLSISAGAPLPDDEKRRQHRPGFCS
ncbi:hypothetical protein [Streptomyces sp. NPDC127033]|uniref:hypothetical protein n=1 Tax=Streptomyces sp. NPDC127033 TaxID=3347110 RepID=UPI0036560F34